MINRPYSVPGPTTVASGPSYQVVSPVDGQLLAHVHDTAPPAVDGLVSAAIEGGRTLAGLSVFDRADLCRASADALLGRVEEIAPIVSWETGRTLASARDEIHKAASGLRLAAEEVVRLYGEVIPVRDRRKLTMTSRHPTGLWAVLSPWNFPVNIPVEYLGPALAAGNPVVWKPAPSTAVSAHALAQVFAAAGVPDGAITLLTCQRLDTAEALVRHPRVVGIGLTGSTATGQAVAASAGGKQLILELGGNGPIIVYADADLALAAEAIAAAGFAASGQICSATGRVLADARIAGDLATLVAEQADRYVLGDPFADETVIGPVHDEGIVTRVRRGIAEALAAGARVLTEEPERDWPTPNYLPATVVADVPLGAALEAGETFGPVVPIVPLPADRLVEVANRGDHALSAAVFTRDFDTAVAAAQQLEFGSVVVNDRSSFWELHLPFGGWSGRSSGTGRVGVPAVLRSMTQVKTMSFSLGQK